MKNKILILTGLSAAILLLSLNRLTSLTSSYLQPYEFLRWLDFNAMIPIPIISVILYYLLLREIVGESSFVKTKVYRNLFLIFIAGVYLFGASSGAHEVTNYLNTRFCERGELKNALCNIISYNDDEFSHLVYYIGFVLLNIPLMLSEFKVPSRVRMSKRNWVVVLGNAIIIGLGVFANLAFERIGLDLYFFGSMMLLAVYLLYRTSWRINNYPILSYFAISYSVGVLGTLMYKLAS